MVGKEPVQSRCRYGCTGITQLSSTDKAWPVIDHQQPFAQAEGVPSADGSHDFFHVHGRANAKEGRVNHDSRAILSGSRLKTRTAERQRETTETWPARTKQTTRKVGRTGPSPSLCPKGCGPLAGLWVLYGTLWLAHWSEIQLGPPCRCHAAIGPPATPASKGAKGWEAAGPTRSRHCTEADNVAAAVSAQRMPRWVRPIPGQ